MYLFTIDSWREIYEEDTVEHNNAKLISAVINYLLFS